MNTIFFENISPGEWALLLHLQRFQDAPLLIDDVLVVRRRSIYFAHDLDSVVYPSVFHEPPRCFWQSEENDGYDDGGQDLDRNGQSPSDGTPDKVHSEGKKVGDGDTEGREQDL